MPTITGSIGLSDVLDGIDGLPGDDSTVPGPASSRSITRRFYSTTQTTAPSFTLTWSNLSLSSVTGWQLNAITETAGGTQVRITDVIFTDATGLAPTTTATGTAPIVSTLFTGVVSFASGDFSVDGAGVTDIDGGNIEADTITLDTLTAASGGSNIGVVVNTNGMAIFSGQSTPRIIIGNLGATFTL